MQVVDVNIPGASYKVSIQPGLRHDIAQQLQACGLKPTSVALVVDEAIARTHGADAEAGLRAAGLRVARQFLQASEENKSISTVETLCQRMLESGLDRKSVVIAMGGGIVGDAAGFAGATYMRGVAVVQVPTTLLAMVDASIGGKTGVNLSQRGGALAKNMVGAFWQPRAVLCDPDVLSTLPPRELTCGLAECLKHAIIADPPLLDMLLANIEAVRAAKSAECTALIARAAAVKASIVARDQREDGERAHLNLGHTFAHAIEALDHASVKHGEAVAIGIVAVAHVAVALGGSSEWNGRTPAAIVSQLGLPARLPRPLPVGALMTSMHSDKKAIDGKLRLVVPFAMGDVRVVEGVDAATVEAAWRSVGAH